MRRRCRRAFLALACAWWRWHWAGYGTPRTGSLPGDLPGMGAFSGPSSDKGGREFGAGTPASGGFGFGWRSDWDGWRARSVGDGQAAFGCGMPPAVVVVVLLVPRCCRRQRRSASRRACAISYAGQLAGISVSGLMETSLNDSALAGPGKSWLGQVAMGVAGARPAMPNSAGGRVGSRTTRWPRAVRPAERAARADGPQPTLPNGGQGGPGSEGKSGSGGNTINNTTNATVQGDSQTRTTLGLPSPTASGATSNMTGR